MTGKFLTAVSVAVLCLAVGADQYIAERRQSMEPAADGLLSVESQRALIEQHCTGCHNQDLRAGGMTLTDLDLEHPDQNAELAEELIRKVRVGMMPPAGQVRPDLETLQAFARSLEQAIDRVAADRPHTKAPELHRVNRTEYRNSIRDLLGIEVDVSELLPRDARTGGFDNMADALTVSPALIQGYVRAASKVSRQAIGDPAASAAMVSYDVPKVVSQMRHVEGTPFGTRGGVSVLHDFPADGEYVFKLEFYYYYTGRLIGSYLPEPLQGQQVEVSVDGERVAVFTIDPDVQETEGMLVTDPIPVEAGQRRLAAAFVSKADGPVEDRYWLVEHTLMDISIANQPGMTALPHLRTLTVTGPTNVTGVSNMPSRQRIFSCYPSGSLDEEPCATEIISRLARRAFRRPVTPEDMEGLMIQYHAGHAVGGFEAGVRNALQAIIAKPEFVFRFERDPAGVSPGEDYPIDDLELASRLSYFLWSSIPDEELIEVASRGALGNPATLRRQVGRMLADPRSEALATNFAGQWLRLQGIDEMLPEPTLYPNYTKNLGQSMRREVELLFDNIRSEDGSVLELLTADYTFVDEVLAKHYRLPSVTGNRFQRVELADPNRHGLLGKGGVLTMTSLANRTSPVARGKYVLEVLLGTPPPAPPPVVPPFMESVDNAKILSVRERMEQHRDNPACSACHQIMDPIGLALENFDATGVWRTTDGGVDIDPSDTMFDGTSLDGPLSLRQALLDRSESFIRSFTENLLAYAVGRVLDYRDMPVVRSIMREARTEGNRFSTFIRNVVESAPFRMSRVPEPESAEQP